MSTLIRGIMDDSLYLYIHAYKYYTHISKPEEFQRIPQDFIAAWGPNRPVNFHSTKAHERYDAVDSTLLWLCTQATDEAPSPHRRRGAVCVCVCVCGGGSGGRGSKSKAAVRAAPTTTPRTITFNSLWNQVIEPLLITFRVISLTELLFFLFITLFLRRSANCISASVPFGWNLL